jgi:hypothetical protein
MSLALPSPLSVSMDAITPLLWQGSRPAAGAYLRERGFRMVVFCAKEFQPPSFLYPGLHIIRARLDDSGAPMTNDEWLAACAASREAARAMRDGLPVYSSCHMGQNRSGLVAALALIRTTGISGKEAVRRVKSARPYALGNSWFRAAIERIPSVRDQRPRPGDVLRARPMPLRPRA